MRRLEQAYIEFTSPKDRWESAVMISAETYARRQYIKGAKVYPTNRPLAVSTCDDSGNLGETPRPSSY